MSNVRYRAVSKDEVKSDDEIKKKDKADRLDRLITKIHALIWVVLGLLTLIYSDVINLGLNDSRINRYALNLAIICFVSNIGIVLYLTIWLPFVQKINIPWEIYCPNMIPISTVLGLISLFLFIVSFWGIYGLLSPLIFLVLLMGMIFSAHFIPWPC